MLKFLVGCFFCGLVFCVNAAAAIPLRQILFRYEGLSGKHVEMIDDINRFGYQVNIDTEDENLTLVQIEEALRTENIGLYEITTNRLVATWIEPNIDMARRYLDRYKQSKITPLIGLFGVEEIREYQAKAPELKKMREQFGQVNELQKSIGMQDAEYRDAMKSYESLPKKTKIAMEKNSAVIRPIIKRLYKENKAYRIAKDKRAEALFLLNIATMEYIINDYEQRGKCVPTKWMNREGIIAPR